MIIINVFLYFIDVNECGNSELNKCLLKDMCVNIEGLFNCFCLRGMYLVNDERICIGKL